MKRKYKINDDYFSVIDSEEKAYWLGFITADGCVHHDNKKYDKINILAVHLAIVDLPHVEKLKKSLDTDYKIHIKQRGVSCQLRVTSLKICNDLSNYGVVARKTGKTDPINIPEQFEVPYWRGYIDGDGSLHEASTKTKFGVYDIPVLSVSGDYKVIYKFKHFLRKNGIVVSDNETFYRNVYKYRVINTKAMSAIKLLYSNASIFLDRKYKCFTDMSLKFANSTTIRSY